MIDTIELGELLRQLGGVIARMEERLTKLEAAQAQANGTMSSERWSGDSPRMTMTETQERT